MMMGVRRTGMFGARCAQRAPRRPVVTKTATGIVGLKVDPDGRANLIALNEKLLDAVQAVPADAAYRKSIEATCGYRLKVARELDDEAAIEDTIGMGQLEELIESQTEEMGVLDMYVEHKMWEAIADLNTEFKNAE